MARIIERAVVVVVLVDQRFYSVPKKKKKYSFVSFTDGTKEFTYGRKNKKKSTMMMMMIVITGNGFQNCWFTLVNSMIGHDGLCVCVISKTSRIINHQDNDTFFSHVNIAENSKNYEYIMQRNK